MSQSIIFAVASEMLRLTQKQVIIIARSHVGQSQALLTLSDVDFLYYRHWSPESPWRLAALDLLEKGQERWESRQMLNTWPRPLRDIYVQQHKERTNRLYPADAGPAQEKGAA